MANNTASVNYVALFQDQSHVCTFLLLFSEGLVCRHFFQIMLHTQSAKFSINLIMSRWYKKGMDTNNILFDSSGMSDQANSIGSSMSGIQHLRPDGLNEDSGIEHTIVKRQIYGECAALGRKLATLAAEYHLTHVAATLQGLIHQVEQSNTNLINQDHDIRNPMQINAKGRPAKRLKLCVENGSGGSKGSIGKAANIRSGEGYTCRNCLKDGHNSRSCNAPCKICKENGHNYLHCPNKENV